MLHVLLLILKIIGIILAVIVGILILVLCTVLFVPLCYQGAAKWDGKWEHFRAQGKITWLFRLIEIRFIYKEGHFAMRVRIAWKRFGGSGGKDPADRAGESRADEKRETQEHIEHRESEPERREEERSEEKNEKNQQESYGSEKEEKADPELPKTDESGKEINEEERDQTLSEAHVEEDASDDEEKSSGNSEKNRKISKTFQKIHGRILAFIKKIKCTFTGICDKISLFNEKKEKIIAFLNDETHKKAFHIIKKELRRLIGNICPGHFRLKVHFGFEDPYHTGQALAGLAVIYPFLPGDVSVVPDFENRVFDGKTELKGRLYTVYLVFAAFQLIRRRAVRTTYYDIRKIFQAEA